MQVKSFRINFFGKNYLDDIDVEVIGSEVNFQLPKNLNFNSNWEIIHDCLNCENQVTFTENLENQFRNYKSIIDVNTSKRSYKFLEKVISLFPNLKIVKLNGVYYVNRTDFEYTHEIQKVSSIELKLHKCKYCYANYLSIIRIGGPIPVERSPSLPGIIEVVQINYLKEDHFLLQNLE